MLSYNFSLIKSSPLRQIPMRTMLFILGIVYLDMYDVALYIGYSVYLSPVVLPHLALYSIFLIFSSVFVVSQFSKIIGYFWFNLLEDSYSQKNATRAPRLIGLCYLILAIQPTYAEIGIYAFYLFLLIRMIQGFAFGFELAFVIRFANAQSQHKSRRYMFYFIIFAGEIGILVSVFVNRFIISQGWDIVLYDHICRLQFFTGFCLIVLHYIFVERKINIKVYSNHFTRLNFLYSLKKDGLYILFRSSILCFNVALIIMIIFRMPNLSHLGLGWSHQLINQTVLHITILSFIGSNFVRLIEKHFKPRNIMLFSYLLGIVVCFVWIYFNLVYAQYRLWMYIIAFLYGAFIRLYPLVMYRLSDFHCHNRLSSRYLGGFLSYNLFGSLTLLALDLAHYKVHSYHDNIALYILIISAVIGIISLQLYTRKFQD